MPGGVGGKRKGGVGRGVGQGVERGGVGQGVGRRVEVEGKIVGNGVWRVWKGVVRGVERGIGGRVGGRRRRGKGGDEGMVVSFEDEAIGFDVDIPGGIFAVDAHIDGLFVGAPEDEAREAGDVDGEALVGTAEFIEERVMDHGEGAEEGGEVGHVDTPMRGGGDGEVFGEGVLDGEDGGGEALADAKEGALGGVVVGEEKFGEFDEVKEGEVVRVVAEGFAELGEDAFRGVDKLLSREFAGGVDGHTFGLDAFEVIEFGLASELPDGGFEDVLTSPANFFRDGGEVFGYLDVENFALHEGYFGSGDVSGGLGEKLGFSGGGVEEEERGIDGDGRDEGGDVIGVKLRAVDGVEDGLPGGLVASDDLEEEFMEGVWGGAVGEVSGDAADFDEGIFEEEEGVLLWNGKRGSGDGGYGGIVGGEGGGDPVGAEGEVLHFHGGGGALVSGDVGEGAEDEAVGFEGDDGLFYIVEDEFVRVGLVGDKLGNRGGLVGYGGEDTLL